MILFAAIIGITVLSFILFLSFRLSNKSDSIKDAQVQIHQLEEIRNKIQNELDIATEEKSRLLSKCEFLLIDNARQDSSLEALKSSIERLEKELEEYKNLYSKTRESLYEERQNLELKKQEMKEFEIRASDWEKSRHEAITQAKAAIFETASSLSKELIENHKKETKESELALSANTVKLQEQFEKIVNNVSILNNEITSSKNSVDTIRNALLSPAGAGNLAEITLENILKSSGLQPNRDFIMQYSFTTRAVDKAMLRPDSVVFLPGDNLMIIDSKSSKYFSELTESQDEESSKKLNEKLKATMRQHLKGLKDKNYNDFLKEHLTDRKVNHISSVMFLPTETSLEKISKIDKDFISLAWEQNIFPVGPSGLINLLIYAKFQISAQTQSENQQLIVEEVRKLLNSVTQLYEHTRKVGNSLHATTNHFDKLAGSFNANFLPKAKNLEKLGIHMQKNKSLPQGLDRLTVVSSNKMELIDVDQERNLESIGSETNE